MRKRDKGREVGDSHPHGVRILVGEKSQESCEAAKPSCEQYEERKLLLRVDRHLMTGDDVEITHSCCYHTSWKTGKSSRSAHSVQLQEVEQVNHNSKGADEKSPRVRVEEVSFLQWIWQQAKGALPCAVQQVQGPVNPVGHQYSEYRGQRTFSNV